MRRYICDSKEDEMYVTTKRGAVAAWLVRSAPGRAVWVGALAEEIVLCSWARHLTLTVSLHPGVSASLLRVGGGRDNPAMD